MFHETTEETVAEIAEFLGIDSDKKPALRVLLESSEKPVSLEALKASMKEAGHVS